MQTESTIQENDRNGGLSINITPGDPSSYLSLEVSDPTTNNAITITVFTSNRVGFLELLKKVVDECVLRVRDNEQTGERDDA